MLGVRHALHQASWCGELLVLLLLLLYYYYSYSSSYSYYSYPNRSAHSAAPTIAKKEKENWYEFSEPVAWLT